MAVTRSESVALPYSVNVFDVKIPDEWLHDNVTGDYDLDYMYCNNSRGPSKLVSRIYHFEKESDALLCVLRWG